MWTCDRLPPSDWPAQAGFILRHNRRADGRARCLHADQGATQAAHAEELAGLDPAECCFIVARANDQPGACCGWIGAEFDRQAGRAWVRGPLLDEVVLPPGPAAAALRAQLVQALLDALPGVARLDAFPSADEAPLVQAFEAEGFQAVATHRVLRHDQPAPPASASATGEAITPGLPALEHRAAVLALHERLFPNSYLPGDSLVASLGADRCLFVAHRGAVLLGYVYAQHQREANQGYIDYLGVQEAARGQGWGRRLLQRALHWARAERGLPAVELTVREDRGHAQQLYRRAGFREVAAGLQLMFVRPASPGPAAGTPTGA